MSPPDRSQTPKVHAGGPPPTARQLLRELVDVAAALPWFAGAPLLRGWHRRWGATEAEVAAFMPGDDLVPGCQYDFPMMRKMLLTIKRRAAGPRRAVSSTAGASPARPGA